MNASDIELRKKICLEEILKICSSSNCFANNSSDNSDNSDSSISPRAKKNDDKTVIKRKRKLRSPDGQRLWLSWELESRHIAEETSRAIAKRQTY